MVSPTIELLHKLTALVAALVLIVGAYALIDPSFRTFTRASLPATAAAAAATPATLQSAFLDLIHDLSSLMPGRATVSAVVAPAHPTLHP